MESRSWLLESKIRKESHGKVNQEVVLLEKLGNFDNFIQIQNSKLPIFA